MSATTAGVHVLQTLLLLEPNGRHFKGSACKQESAQQSTREDHWSPQCRIIPKGSFYISGDIVSVRVSWCFNQITVSRVPVVVYIFHLILRVSSLSLSTWQTTGITYSLHLSIEATHY